MARQLEWPFPRVRRQRAALDSPAVERRKRTGRPRRANLEEGLRELERFIAEVGGGRIETPDVRDGCIVVPMRARDGELYRLEMQVTRYVDVPPRCRFVDARGDSPATAWPNPDPGGPFRSPTFICTPPTAEYYSAHSDRVYRGEGTLENTVATIYTALQAPGYSGRLERRRMSVDRERMLREIFARNR